ncbi:THO complex subunit 5 homolog [Salvelinus sp. IW2-2015]|uniref:THO complex subunit 5 homolog n=1 Tax=Salvelinus sp. IW2-2015 TaxID=2691554 RepID=UPI0038D36379
MSEALKKRKSKVLRSEMGTPEVKRGRGEGDQDVRVYSEEVELDGRDPEEDYQQYKLTCEALAQLMNDIQELKANGAKDGCAEVEQKRMQSCIHFMSLKKLNRLAHMRLKRGRDQTHEGKQRVDVLHLQLQNLLYEVMHLQKEISKCLEFKSKHEEIDLVSVDEFYQEAPPEVSRTPLTKDDTHQLTLARLDWELEQRKRLAEQYMSSQLKESLSSKEKIQKGIEVKKEHLSSLQPGLNAIMQASLPVQEYLSMPFEQTQRQTEIARHLPPSLYVLLVQASAYGQACDKSLSVSISGDVDEAKALSKPPEDSQDDDSGDSDAEEEQEKTVSVRVSHTMLPLEAPVIPHTHVSGSTSSPLLYPTQPSYLHNGSVLHLLFYYLMNLNIMTVKAKVSTATDLTGAISAGCVYTRLALHKQSSSLEHSIVPVSSECQHLFPAKVLSRLARWTTITHQEYTNQVFTQHVSEAGLARETDLFFMAVLERGTARLQAAVVLNPCYPVISPLFAVSLSWKGERSGRTDDNLRAMESEVNVFKSELQGPRPGHQLLTNQVARLGVCLDVYLETDGQDDSVEGPREFPREKMCLRTVRGPNRLKPFKYNHPQGFFSHR